MVEEYIIRGTIYGDMLAKIIINPRSDQVKIVVNEEASS